MIKLKMKSNKSSLLQAIKYFGLVLTITLVSCTGSKTESETESETKAESKEGDKKSFISTEVQVIIGEKSKIYSLKQLKKKQQLTFQDYEAIGGKKGKLGINDWTGVSIKDLLLEVEPELSNSINSEREILITSIDGWEALVKWPELFGKPRGGEVLYNIKGCNECHGFNAEGTAPAGKLRAPELINQEYDRDIVSDILRAGFENHANIKPFTIEMLNDSDLDEIMDWLENPGAPIPNDAYRPDPLKQRAILAHKMNGKNMTAEDGLIQLIVEMDEFSSRYSHWVSKIEVK